MNVLLIDLNNFSRYPTMAIGYFAAILRQSGATVTVLSPFAYGVPSYPRTTRPKPWGLVEAGLRYWTATTPSPLVRNLRSNIVDRLRPTNDANQDIIMNAADAAITGDTDVVLLSVYTMYFEVSRRLCELASSRGVPVLIGGPSLALPSIAERWTTIAGVTAVYGGEPEKVLVELVQSLVNGNDVSAIPGVSMPGRPVAPPAPPDRDLDAIPFPDYTDFPWDKYPNRIIPMMTGRGCGWNACEFCADVITSSGRRFRSRTPANVLEEMKLQSQRHETNLFTFLDLKLNSDLDVWRALAEESQSAVPGAMWTASIHVQASEDNGLSAQEFRAARRGGLVRMTTGVESGSRKILDAMAKGSDPEVTSQALRHAHEAGISIRVTAIYGYPGEEPDDILATAKFLNDHRKYIDRVVLNRFTVNIGTVAQRRIDQSPDKYPSITDINLDYETATMDHRNSTFHGRPQRVAALKLLSVVHSINRTPRTSITREFEGVM